MRVSRDPRREERGSGFFPDQPRTARPLLKPRWSHGFCCRPERVACRRNWRRRTSWLLTGGCCTWIRCSSSNRRPPSPRTSTAAATAPRPKGNAGARTATPAAPYPSQCPAGSCSGVPPAPSITTCHPAWTAPRITRQLRPGPPPANSCRPTATPARLAIPSARGAEITEEAKK